MKSTEEAIGLGCGCITVIVLKLIPVALFVWAVIYIVDALK